MAQLSGIRTITHTLLTYEGNQYEVAKGPVQFGDIVLAHSDRYSDIEKGAYYLINLKHGAYVGIKDDASDLLGIDDKSYDEFEYSSNSSDFTVYRIVAPTLSTAELIGQKRTDLACINAELAELEAKYAEELYAKRPKVGDYARLISGGSDIPDGAIVIVTQAEEDDYAGDLPLEVASVLLPESDAEWVTKCERLTPAEAKSALLAQVEALFNVEEADESRGI